MKNFLFILSIQFFVFQLSKAQIKIDGLSSTGGVNKDQSGATSTTQDTDNKGGTGGLKIFIKLNSETFHLIPEVFIINNTSNQYYTSAASLGSSLMQNNVSLNYCGLYLPLDISIPFSDGDKANGLNFQVKTYFDYAMGGTINPGLYNEDEVKFNKNSNKLDLGVGLNGAITLDGWTFASGYNKGLKNIQFSNALPATNPNIPNQKYSFSNKGLNFQVGYVYKF